MIKAIIIDDEEDARFLLKTKIEKVFKDTVVVVAQASSVKSGIEAIALYKPDLVFLDIQMGDGTGFDLLDRIAHKDFEVVFVTAYNQYALKAFRFSALGYIMKPIKTDELTQTVNVIIQYFAKYRSSSDKRLKVLIENYGDDKKIKKMVIPCTKGFDVISLEDIICLEGDRNYTHFLLKDKTKTTSSKTMGEYEALLAEHGFFRIHQSHIINLRYVKSYIKGDGGTVEMADGKQLQLSRNRKNEFLKKFI